MKQTTKQWIKNWFKGLKEVEEKHNKMKDGLWISDSECVDYLMEAQNILEKVLEED